MNSYNLFEKKSAWYVCYRDYEGKKHQKLLKNCRTKQEAEKTAARLSIWDEDQYLIKNIAADMYLPDSQHLKRLTMLGKKFAAETLYQKRYQIEIMLKQFGECDIRKLKVRDVELFFMNDDVHSGSWKNNVMDTFLTVYDETIWKCSSQVQKPHFQRFARNTKKADVFTMDELKRILNPAAWKDYADFLAFYIIASCGLRVGGLRAVRVSQIFWKEKILLVNGFCKNDGFRTNYNKKGSEDNKKTRVVPLSDKLISMLKNYIVENNRKCDDFLFYNHTGEKPVAKEHLWRQFKIVLNETGVYNPNRRLIPHSLRFTYVTYMRTFLEAEQVRRIVGHATMDMTDYYTRFSLQNEIIGIKDSFSAVNRLF